MSESSYSVDEFCKAERISRVSLYKLWKQGRGPAFMKVGTRTTISPQARREWHDRMEREAAAKKTA